MKGRALTLSQLSKQHASKVLLLSISFMSLLTIRRMVMEFNRLIWVSVEMGAIDLNQRYREVLTWFSGETVYGEVHTAVYPPASYVILWPFLGHGSFSLARWLWAISTVIALVVLICLLLKESNAYGWLERSFIALMVLSIYATSQTIGVGQLTIHVMVLLVAGLVCRRYSTLLTSVLMTLALIKPTLSLPFCWRTVFGSNRYRLILLIGLEYFFLAAIATCFQDGDLISLHADWLASGISGAEWGSSGGGGNKGGNGFGFGIGTGYGNVHDWLGAAGLSHLNMPASLVILFGLGYWTYRYRTIDSWLLIGVTSIVARLWTYHLVYDDLLILLPMITLFRMMKLPSIGWFHQQMCGWILAISLTAALIPASFRLRPPPWNYLFTGGQTVVWLMMLLFLVYLTGWCKQRQILTDTKLLKKHQPIKSS
ncbi:MAG: glycosyltransferase family 87 protein [Leptolyngbyaceae cyanobacterium MO_188.B28]|nr:glycosyltransferase family 87 protein [Leptolyngbyaceae cyanobacterium MO_188.B28]